ncbi:MAG: hypothetical protein COC06_11485 [Bacteroidales bacterium]|nr:MAG: hypothetical protein COC06_11485 [Bacteroidales bacterium]
MKRKNSLYSYKSDNIHPGFSIDCVILSFHKKKLRILLNKFYFSEYWQLPGGFMLKDESSDEAATRILSARTRLSGIYLKQFYLFSDPNRTKMDQNRKYIEKDTCKEEYEEDIKKWFLQRFISLGYYAFVKYDDVNLVSVKEDTAKWFTIDKLPDLYSDHKNIIKTALEMIRSMVSILLVAYKLLPEKFTMSDLRKIYETFWDKTLDRRNFQRKVLSTGVLIQLDERGNTSPHNPPILYTFNKEKMVDDLNLLMNV